MIETFSTFKSRLELAKSFDEKIQARHAAVRSALQNIEPSIDTKLIGSLARKTRIQPRPGDVFDVDILIVRGSFDRWLPTGGLTADKAINDMLSLVQQRERYASKSPSSDKPTINIAYDDNTRVELVPAYRDNIGQSWNGPQHSPVGRAYWVPKPLGWELADYEYDAEYVTQQNGLSDGWLVPTIKMLKSIKRHMFAYVPSFYFEMLATFIVAASVKALKSHTVTIAYPLLITQFFQIGSSNWLDMPLSFPGSLTAPVKLDPAIAENAKHAFDVIGRYAKSISSEAPLLQQRTMWRELVGDPFPTQ